MLIFCFKYLYLHFQDQLHVILKWFNVLWCKPAPSLLTEKHVHMKYRVSHKGREHLHSRSTPLSLVVAVNKKAGSQPMANYCLFSPSLADGIFGNNYLSLQVRLARSTPSRWIPSLLPSSLKRSSSGSTTNSCLKWLLRLT